MTYSTGPSHSVASAMRQSATTSMAAAAVIIIPLITTVLIPLMIGFDSASMSVVARDRIRPNFVRS